MANILRHRPPKVVKFPQVSMPGFRGSLVLQKARFYALPTKTRLLFYRSIQTPNVLRRALRRKHIVKMKEMNTWVAPVLNPSLGFCLFIFALIALGFLSEEMSGMMAMFAPLFKSKITRSSLEEVLVVSAPGRLGDQNLTCSVDATTRSSGGLRGIKVIDQALASKAEYWAQVWSKELQKLGKNVSADVLLSESMVKCWSASHHLSAIELPGADTLSDDQTETLTEVVATFCEQQHALVIRGPQSSVILKVWDRSGAKTPLTKVVDTLAGDCVDIQQYVLSLMQATVAAPIAGADGLSEEAFVALNDHEGMKNLGRDPSIFVVYDNNLPVGHVGDIPVYLADAGSDGTYNASGFCADKIVVSDKIGSNVQVDSCEVDPENLVGAMSDRRGQCRGFNLGGLDDPSQDCLPGMIVKGMRETQLLGFLDHGETTDDGQRVVSLTLPRMDCWSRRVRGTKVEALDLDMIKGLGKTHPAFLWAKANVQPGKAVVVSARTYMWLIRITKMGNTLATSFQNTARWVTDQTVREDNVCRILEKAIFGAPADVKSIIDNLHSRVLKKLGLPEDHIPGRVPYRTFVESMDSKVARMASSATTRTMRMGKERQTHLAFLKWLITSEGMLEYSDADKAELELQWKLEWYADNHGIENTPRSLEAALKACRWAEEQSDLGRFTNESWGEQARIIQNLCEMAWRKEKRAVLHPMFRKVAQARVPTTTDRNPTVATAMSKQGWLLLAEAVRTDSNQFVGTDGVTYRTEVLLNAILCEHNRTIDIKEFAPEEGNKLGLDSYKIESLQEAKRKLLSLAYSIEFANLNGTFLCHPAESRDRQADSDGDDTGCDSSLFWVRINSDIEYRADLKENIVVEFPKSMSEKWDAEKHYQDFDIPDGSKTQEKHVKAKNLTEMLPSLEHCTRPRLRQIHKVLLAALQGATGLASNQEVDIYIRIKWEIVEDKDGKKVCQPTQETELYYDLWILYVLFVQLMIDNQKRTTALPYFDEKSWRKIPRAIRAAGGKGLKSLEGLGLEMAEAHHTLLKKKFLAVNRTFNPELVYRFAAKVMDLDSTVDYKASSKDGSIRKTPEEIFTALINQPFDRTNRVWQTAIAACKPEGWRAKYAGEIGYTSNYTQKIAKAFDEQTENLNPLLVKATRWLAARVPVAMREVELANLAKGENAQDLSKMSAMRRGRIFLRGLGFEQKQIVELANGNTGHCAAYHNLKFTPEVVAIAMALGSRSRPVDAYEIFVSFIIAEQETSDELKQALAWGDARRETILRRAACTPEKSPIAPNTTGLIAMCSDSVFPTNLRKDWGSLANAAHQILTCHSHLFIEQATKTVQNPYDVDEVVAAACLIASPVANLLRVGNLLSSRKNFIVPHLAKKDLQAHREMSRVRLPSETRMGKNAPRSTGKTVGWLKAVVDSDDMRYTAWKALKHGRPVSPSGDITVLRNLVMGLWDSNPSLLIKSRTLFGGAGWHSATTGNACHNTAVNTSLWRAKSALGGTCSSLLAGEDTREEVAEPDEFGEVEVTRSQPMSKGAWHATLLEGKVGMTLEVPQNLHHRFTQLFGSVTPIPASFTIILHKGMKFERTFEGANAVGKLYSDALALRVSQRFFSGTQTLEQATKDFFDARQEFFALAAQDDMAYWDEEANAWQFDPTFDERALRPLMALSLWKQEKVNGSWVVVKEPDVMSTIGLQRRKQEVLVRNESYSQLGL
jgi:hypothetical protein